MIRYHSIIKYGVKFRDIKVEIELTLVELSRTNSVDPLFAVGTTLTTWALLGFFSYNFKTNCDFTI